MRGYKISGNGPDQFGIQKRRYSSGNSRGMKIPSSFDHQTLQQLLANAFAVQESQIDPRCLSDIMEVQRAVRTGKFSLDGAMRHIVESARTVANATGVAIALIDAGDLRYRAGSGSSAVCIGWRVGASLTVSATTRTNREILHVEDAQTDTRIEADICRQFGANALLILPIYFQGAVAGVLDVRFNEAHVFQDPEVRTYRLMAEQVEAALALAPQQEPQENLAAQLPPNPEFFEPVPADAANFVFPADDTFALPQAENCDNFESLAPPPDFMMLPENEHSLYARCGALLADIMKLPVFKQSAWLASLLTQQAKHIRVPSRPRRSTPAGGLSSVLKRPALTATAFVQWTRNSTWSDRWRRLSFNAAKDVSSSFKRSSSRAAVFAQRVRSSSWPHRWRRSYLATARELLSALTRSASITAAFAHRAKALIRLNERRRVAVEVIVIVLAFTALIAYRGRVPAKLLESSTQSNSSTMTPQEQPPKPLPGKSASQDPQASFDPQAPFDPQASFDPSPMKSRHAGTALRQVRKGPNEVDYVADDVTMRVFTNKSAAKRSRPANGQVAQFGDDVTVRYFTPPPTPTRTATR